jgi:hypothetical protein
MPDDISLLWQFREGLIQFQFPPAKRELSLR